MHVTCVLDSMVMVFISKYYAATPGEREEPVLEYVRWSHTKDSRGGETMVKNVPAGAPDKAMLDGNNDTKVLEMAHRQGIAWLSHHSDHGKGSGKYKQFWKSDAVFFNSPTSNYILFAGAWEMIPLFIHQLGYFLSNLGIV